MAYCPKCGFAMEPNEKFCGNCGFNIKESLNLFGLQNNNNLDTGILEQKTTRSADTPHSDSSKMKQELEFKYCQECGHRQNEEIMHCQVCKSNNLSSFKPKSFPLPKYLISISILQLSIASFDLLIGIFILISSRELSIRIFGMLYVSMAIIIIFFLILMLLRVTTNRAIFIFLFSLECVFNFGIGTLIGIPMLIYFSRPKVKAFLHHPFYKEVKSNAT